MTDTEILRQLREGMEEHLAGLAETWAEDPAGLVPEEEARRELLEEWLAWMDGEGGVAA
jgi:hypothetical protein